MRKTIVLIIQIILLVLFLRSSFAQHFFGDAAKQVLTWFESVSSLPERQQIMTLRDTFMRNNMSLKPHQVDYVIEVTETVESINKFYQLYCVKDDKNPYIYGANLKKFCNDIADSELLISS
ncbi:hypothetical protein [Glaciecola petra]|uniref:Uncharacterized protein n=1 Tax=Glaciecola petra TaxID=3075602 RepID=A0ABU2ZL85_9ALTE|nr:hypothetical protein [Aestuariibacter sp. P117]MDT0593388.1 hypothetical protein [Aestuariibacter sp. P117]